VTLTFDLSTSNLLPQLLLSSTMFSLSKAVLFRVSRSKTEATAPRNCAMLEQWDRSLSDQSDETWTMLYHYTPWLFASASCWLTAALSWQFSISSRFTANDACWAFSSTGSIAVLASQTHNANVKHQIVPTLHLCAVADSASYPQWMKMKWYIVDLVWDMECKTSAAVWCVCLLHRGSSWIMFCSTSS